MAVYFARAEGTDLTKIGFAVSTVRRMLHLQAGCPYRLTLVRELPGGRLDEAMLQKHFRAQHVERDWFRWIDTMATVQISDFAKPVEPGFAALIHELGGAARVAKETGIGLSAVKKMRARNRCPSWHWPALVQLGVPMDRLISCQQAAA